MVKRQNKVSINPEKIAVGCKVGDDDILRCNPKLKHNGKLIPLTDNAPIVIKHTGESVDVWEKIEGGTDMTFLEKASFDKALKKTGIYLSADEYGGKVKVR